MLQAQTHAYVSNCWNLQTQLAPVRTSFLSCPGCWRPISSHHGFLFFLVQEISLGSVSHLPAQTFLLLPGSFVHSFNNFFVAPPSAECRWGTSKQDKHRYYPHGPHNQLEKLQAVTSDKKKKISELWGHTEGKPQMFLWGHSGSPLSPSVLQAWSWVSFILLTFH